MGILDHIRNVISPTPPPPPPERRREYAYVSDARGIDDDPVVAHASHYSPHGYRGGGGPRAAQILNTAEIYADGGARPEIEMAHLVWRRRTDYLFNLVVKLNTAFSVGAGFHNTCADTADGKNALKVVDTYCEEWDMDTLNQSMADDAWATGNAFLDSLMTERREMVGLKMIPLSSITGIRRDEYGVPLSYRQQWGGDVRDIEADYILHLRWAADDANAWGSGLGQIMARRGLGYQSNSGKTIRKPSLFSSREMLSDIATKITYAGQPRYVAVAPNARDEAIQDIGRKLDNLDPLQHMITSVKDTKIEQMSLDTQGRYDTFFRHIDDDTVAALISPVIRLWTSMSFTYASAKEAVDMLMPLIRYYQRRHKRFIEHQIYRKIVSQEFGWDIQRIRGADIQIMWGRREPMTIELISKIHHILTNDHRYDGLWSPQDIIDMLREAGADLNPMDDADMSKMQQEADALNKQEAEMRDVKRVHISSLDKQREQQEYLKTALLQKLLQGGRR